MTWLNEALAHCTLTEDVEGYYYSRGAKEGTLREEGIVTWTPTEDPIPDKTFSKRYGPHGEKINGLAICPVRSPKGKLIGFEGRSIHTKYITDYRLPEAAWNPFWIGTVQAVDKLWKGGDAWIVEGQFDKYPLEWVVPEKDAVLASVRAHLSLSHVEFLRRHCRGWVHMVYDQDETGRVATLGGVDKHGKKIWGAVESLERVGLRSRDVHYSGGKDPGEIWDRGGVAAMRAAFPIL